MNKFFLTFNTKTGRPISYQNINNNLNEDLLRKQVQLGEPDYDVFPVSEDRAPTAFMARVDGSWVLRNKTELRATWDKITVAPTGVDVMILSPLPIPCSVLIDSVEYEVDDGVLEFSADAPGTYTMSIDHVAHTRQEWKIHVS